MAKIQKDIPLAPFNTFSVPSIAKYFIEVDSTDDLRHLGDFDRTFFLGAGANVLFVDQTFEGLIIKNNLRGKKIVEEDSDSVTVEIASGEDWHEFVMWTVENNWSGIENLALIPGTVGAAPVQNIAAYGQTAGGAIASVSGLNFGGFISNTISSSDCKFYYRDSIFKHDLKNKFFVTSVAFKLSKSFNFSTSYWGVRPNESLQAEIDKLSEPPYSPKIVAQAVINLRKIKLPDWRVTPTAGSVFKNPFISKMTLTHLQKAIPNLQVYPVDNMLYPNPADPVFKMSDMVKIPAGQLLDKLGWLGKKIGNVSTHPKHALIVINCGGATGKEIYEYIQSMKADVKKNFGIDLEEEIVIV